MAITTLTELESAISNWLNRSDLTDRIPEFIDLAEARIQQDRRLVQHASRDFTGTEGFTLPADFAALVELYHDGPTYYGRIALVSPTELSERKLRHGDSGVPRWASVIAGASTKSLRFAPEPPTTGYAMRMIYEAFPLPLNDSDQTTNWLLTQAPQIYLYAALSEGAGYLLDEQVEQKWLAKYEQAAAAFYRNKMREAYSGPLTPRPRHIIGEGV